MYYTQNFTVMDYDFTDGICREDGDFGRGGGNRSK